MNRRPRLFGRLVHTLLLFPQNFSCQETMRVYQIADYDYEDKSEKRGKTQNEPQKRNDLQLKHHMNPRVSEIFSHFGQQDIHLLGLPAQKLRVESEGKSFKTVFDLYKVPAAECFLRKRRRLATSFDCKANISFVWSRKIEDERMTDYSPSI